MRKLIAQTGKSWRTAWNDIHFRGQVIFSIVLLAAVSMCNFHYLSLWEFRTGERLNDVLLNILPPLDFSNIIFFFTYSTIIITMLSTLYYPGIFVRGLQAFSLVTALRTASIYFFPLEPPADMILLVDPVSGFLLNGESVVVTKDLFFSGHTATLTLMFMCAQHKYLKTFCFVALMIAPALLIWQHVHYTVDVLVAPFVVYGCVKFVDWTNHNFDYGKVLFKY